jgi:hypothetical protein
VKAYKFLTAEGHGVFSGFAWPLPSGSPGEWVAAEVELCRSGVHACRPGDLSYWLAPALYEIELRGEVAEAGTKVVAPRGRLVRRIDGWSDETPTLRCASRRRASSQQRHPRLSARGLRRPQPRPEDPP